MKIAFLDHNFHAHTKSSHFFMAILERIGSVDIFYIDPERVDQEVEEIKDLEKYDLVVFWQITPKVKTIRGLATEKVVFIPMYDGCHQTSIAQWAKYRKYRFVAFSYQLHRSFLRAGIASFFLQYVPLVDDKYLSTEKEKQPTIYIWKRHKSFQLQPLITSLQKMGIKKAICHETTEADQQEIYPIEIEFTSGWYPTHDDYINAISQCHYYLAPRLYEGIGMSFLEAMGCGLCVLAPNRATMNEYIVDGENGILFDSYQELANKTIHLEQIARKARETYLEIQAKWNQGEKKLISFLQTQSQRHSAQKPWFLYFLQDWRQRRLLRRHKVEDFR